jgi:hypothetical protein
MFLTKYLKKNLKQKIKDVIAQHDKSLKILIGVVGQPQAKKQKNIGAVFYALLLKRFLYIVAFTTNGVDTSLHNRIKGSILLLDNVFLFL